MASFCEKCGFPQSASSAFCPQCGTRHMGGTPAPPPAFNPAFNPQAMPPVARTGSGMKVVLVVLGCLAVAGMAAIGGLHYLAHKVKQVVVQKAEENGADLSAITPSKHTRTEKPRYHSPCDLLSKEEASRLLGEPVERTTILELSCVYLGPKGLSAKLAQENAHKTFKRAQAPGTSVDGTDVANAVDQMVNSLGAQAGQTGVDGELPLLMLGVDQDGKGQMIAMSASKALFNGIVNGSEGKNGKGFGADIPGLGDKAVRMPKLGLRVLKGDTVIAVMVGPVPDADAKSIDIARAVLPRI
jgi:hypothetical protein